MFLDRKERINKRERDDIKQSCFIDPATLGRLLPFVWFYPSETGKSNRRRIVASFRVAPDFAFDKIGDGLFLWISNSIKIIWNIYPICCRIVFPFNILFLTCQSTVRFDMCWYIFASSPTGRILLFFFGLFLPFLFSNQQHRALFILEINIKNMWKLKRIKSSFWNISTRTRTQWKKNSWITKERLFCQQFYIIVIVLNCNNIIYNIV